MSVSSIDCYLVSRHINAVVVSTVEITNPVLFSIMPSHWFVKFYPTPNANGETDLAYVSYRPHFSALQLLRQNNDRFLVQINYL